MNKKEFFLAIDIGGTKIDFCRFDEDFNLLFHERFLTKNFPTGKNSFLKEILKIAKKHQVKELKRVGVSINCSVKKGVIKYASFLGGKINYPLALDFSKKLNLPVSVINDVYAMALAELYFSKNKDKDFTLINLGTGLRLAHISSGKPLKGSTEQAGEIGSIEVCLPELNHKTLKMDDLVSGKGLENIFYCLAGKKEKAEFIFNNLNRDKNKKKAVAIFNDYLVELLGQVSFFYNPETIVLSGGLLKSQSKFLPIVRKKYLKKVPGFFRAKKIIVSKINLSAAKGALLSDYVF